MVTKKTTKKTASPKPRKKATAKSAKESVAKKEPVAAKKHPVKGKYIFATGRRKTSIANVRLFEGKGDMVINNKPLKDYFNYGHYHLKINQPFSVTGLEGKYYAVCNTNGGGAHSQVEAVRHGISLALATVAPEIRKVLKKNGFLTRDDRKKERKKPGKKRARRSPQWAKR